MTIYSVCASKSADCKLQKWAWSILIRIKVNLIQCAISKFYFENVILGPRYDVFLVKDQWDIISHLALHWHPLKDSFSKYFAVLAKEPLREYKG